MTTILISGGRGLVGRHLCRKLKEKGFNVNVLSTTKEKADGVTTYLWNIDRKEIDKKAVNEVDYIIHLAGSNIGEKRWTNKRKQFILDSRVQSAQLLFDTLKERKKILKAFISASAIGYYGAITSDQIFTETDPPANDFLGKTCKLWERSADLFKDAGIRTVKIRTGVVLTKQGGALAKMMIPVKMGIGSALGSGKQYLPWIHIEDLCEIYIKAVEDIQMTGSYNAVAPDNKTNKEFTRALAHALNKPFWFPPVPALILKLFFGEMSDMILKGSRVSSAKIMASGFTFKFPDLESAFDNLFQRGKQADE